MAYVFLAFAHVEALSGIVFLAAALIFLIVAGRNRAAMQRRILAAISGILVYSVLAVFGLGARSYVAMVVDAQGIAAPVLLLAVAVAAAIVLAHAVVAARSGSAMRAIATGACAFAFAAYADGYVSLWTGGLGGSILATLPFILFNGAAFAAGLILLYRPSS